MTIRTHSTLAALERDMERQPARAQKKLTAVVVKNVAGGTRLAQRFARQSEGSHGVHYDDAIDGEMTGPTRGEYGPDPSKPQGGMSFEEGSRHQRPHRDLAKSADVYGPKLADDALKAADELSDIWRQR